MRSWNRLSGLVMTIPALAFAAGCGETEPTSSLDPGPSLVVQRAPEKFSRLAACETAISPYATARIGPAGGVLAAGPAVVFIPPHAVATTTRFTVEPLAGRTLRVRITAGGHEHFGFARPIAVMIGYAHCGRQEFDAQRVSVWHVDDQTNALLERMPAINDSRNETVGFLTTHLSTYAVAN
jgi:hypothetical protein